MRELMRVYRRELGAYFASPIAYLFIGVFLAVTLYTFFWGEAFFARNIADVQPLFKWMPILLIALVAALTMRSWSEERRADTLELLLTSPVSSLRLTGGKFLAALTLVIVALALTFSLPLTVEFLGPLDWGPVIGGYVASIFLAAAYVAIGLFISSRTDNQIVSLLVTAIVGGLLYLVGSDWVLALVPPEVADVLRLIGTSARFDEIQRGVLDLRDLYYYVSLVAVFLSLNVYSLEKVRWGGDKTGARRHNTWRAATVLVIANFLVANLWLLPITSARADLTENNLYSLSDTTRTYLDTLAEPLIIRGYFSSQTHPLLKPLVPQMRNLLREYDVVGGDDVKVKFVDPTQNPVAARKAQSKYGIRPVSLRTASRYKTSVVNTYFHVVVKYGNEYAVLSYRDLIKMKRSAGMGIAVGLRNPEYEITRTIRKVVHQYRSSGKLLVGLDQLITVHAYVSPAKELPKKLAKLRSALEDMLKQMQEKASGMLAVEFDAPMKGKGQLAKRLKRKYGFRPMVTSLLSKDKFWFYLVLEQGSQTVAIQPPQKLTKEALREAIEAGMQRLVGGYLKTVAVYLPPSSGRMRSAGASFHTLLNILRENAAVTTTDLSSGQAPSDADMLIVLAPHSLSEKQRFAIDQFLMSGGTVMIAASPLQVTVSPFQGIQVDEHKTGLADWLARYGVDIQESLVLDPQSGHLVLPVRVNGSIRLNSMKYPYFVYVRDEGLADVPLMGDLRRMIMAWTSPIEVNEKKAGKLKVTPLVQSSPMAWASDNNDVLPNYKLYPGLGFATPPQRSRQTLAVMVQGQFTSAFKDEPSPLMKLENMSDGEKALQLAKAAMKPGKQPKPGDDGGVAFQSVIEHSPDNARLIVFGSAAFVSDGALQIVGRSIGTRYLKPAMLVQNIVDWSTGDRALLAIRDGSRFARLLRPISNTMRLILELANYATALGGLILIFIIQRGVAARRRRRYLRILNKEAV